MRIKKSVKTIILLFLINGLLSCNKGWLDEKRDIALAIPTSLIDMRALLNNNLLQFDYLGMGEVSTNDYYLEDATFNRMDEVYKSLHIWSETIHSTIYPVMEWDQGYQQVFYTNVVLEALENIKPKQIEQDTWKVLKGEALFYRSKSFYNLAQLFANVYQPDINSNDFGIPLRLTADINYPIQRASLKETFDQVIGDYKLAISLLPLHSQWATYPTKASGYSALARCYLSIRNYSEALLYADSALKLNTEILDFSQLSTGLNYPIASFNIEMINSSRLWPLYSDFSPSNGLITQEILDLYEDNDLRKFIYFQSNGNGTFGFRGGHHGSLQLSSGSTSGEMLLIRAECKARSGRYNEALQDLNTLLEKRYDDTFIPIQLPNEKVLTRILLERRKELLRRGLRWTDLRRLNLESEHQVTLHRMAGGISYELLPNDLRYTMPIPEYIIKSSGISQNIRQ